MKIFHLKNMLMILKSTYINQIIDVRNALEKFEKCEQYSESLKIFPLITACCTIKVVIQESKNNIEQMNGLILIDIDEDIDVKIYLQNFQMISILL